MSAAGVQRAIVRMMFDAGFREAIYAGDARALASCDVSDQERGWLVGVDRRAYVTDATRAARALLALEEELPAACAWARGEGRRLEAFFASDELHRCIEERGVLTLAFAAWLGRGASQALVTLAALESAVARGRRAAVRKPDELAEQPAASLPLRLSPRATLIATDDAALAWWAAVREAAAVGAGLPSWRVGAPCTVLIEVKADGDAAAEVLADGLATLLDHARAPIDRTALEAHGLSLGLDPAEAAELVGELLASGLLTAA
jgi:hypothetical protein